MEKAVERSAGGKEYLLQFVLQGPVGEEIASRVGGSSVCGSKSFLLSPHLLFNEARLSVDPSLGAAQAHGPREHRVSCLESLGVGANSGALSAVSRFAPRPVTGVTAAKPPGSVLCFRRQKCRERI